MVGVRLSEETLNFFPWVSNTTDGDTLSVFFNEVKQIFGFGVGILDCQCQNNQIVTGHPVPSILVNASLIVVNPHSLSGFAGSEVDELSWLDSDIVAHIPSL